MGAELFCISEDQLVKSISLYNQKPQIGGLGTLHISSLTD